jgi:hypothetical protein
MRDALQEIDGTNCIDETRCFGSVNTAQCGYTLGWKTLTIEVDIININFPSAKKLNQKSNLTDQTIIQRINFIGGERWWA